jgi:hypothetical protein
MVSPFEKGGEPKTVAESAEDISVPEISLGAFDFHFHLLSSDTGIVLLEMVE